MIILKILGIILVLFLIVVAVGFWALIGMGRTGPDDKGRYKDAGE